MRPLPSFPSPPTATARAAPPPPLPARQPPPLPSPTQTWSDESALPAGREPADSFSLAAFCPTTAPVPVLSSSQQQQQPPKQSPTSRSMRGVAALSIEDCHAAPAAKSVKPILSLSPARDKRSLCGDCSGDRGRLLLLLLCLALMLVVILGALGGVGLLRPSSTSSSAGGAVAAPWQSSSGSAVPSSYPSGSVLVSLYVELPVSANRSAVAAELQSDLAANIARETNTSLAAVQPYVQLTNFDESALAASAASAAAAAAAAAASDADVDSAATVQTAMSRRRLLQTSNNTHTSSSSSSSTGSGDSNSNSNSNSSSSSSSSSSSNYSAPIKVGFVVLADISDVLQGATASNASQTVALFAADASGGRLVSPLAGALIPAQTVNVTLVTALSAHAASSSSSTASPSSFFSSSSSSSSSSSFPSVSVDGRVGLLWDLPLLRDYVDVSGFGVSVPLSASNVSCTPVFSDVVLPNGTLGTAWLSPCYGSNTGVSVPYASIPASFTGSSRSMPVAAVAALARTMASSAALPPASTRRCGMC